MVPPIDEILDVSEVNDESWFDKMLPVHPQLTPIRVTMESGTLPFVADDPVSCVEGVLQIDHATLRIEMPPRDFCVRTTWMCSFVSSSSYPSTSPTWSRM